MREQPASRLRRAAMAAGIIATLVGSGHLVAWVTGAMVPAALSTIIMKTNAALGITLCGLALVLVSLPGESAARRRTVQACALVALGVGLGTLSEHIVGWDLGIDQLLAMEPPGAAATMSPNRMGPPASASLVLLAAALLTLTARNGRRARRALHEPLAATVALLGLLSTVGYLYHVNALYTVARFTGIAWPTAVTLIVLAVGVFCVRADTGWMARVTADDPGGALVRSLLGPIVLLPLALGWAWLMGERRGWFDSAMGTALIMLLFIVTFSALLLFAGRRVSVAAAAQRASDLAFARNEEFLAFALETARMGAWDLDLLDHTARRSLEHDRIFGYPALLPEWTYERFLAHVVAEDRQMVDRKFREAMEAGADWNFQCRIRRHDGEMRWIWASGRSRLDEDGAPTRMVGVVQDITERHAAEAALQESEQQLRALNDRLQQADRRKDEFLAILSHELRNPLSPIRAALYVMERSAPGSEQATRARTVIDRQVTQLTRLVDDLLDVTRITRGKFYLQRAAVSLTELVRRTADDHRALFASRGLTLAVEIPDDALWVNGDAQRLAQAIGNLLHNAAKFTECGGGAVVRVSRERPDIGVVSVTDTGLGLSAVAIGQVFEPFVQVDATLDRARGGLGLGLALVKSVAEMHGGSVSATSAGVGKGAQFTIRLPLQAGVPEPQPQREAIVQAPRRVLIVEDNRDAAESLREALTLAGHDVEVASSGAEGIQKGRRFKPEVVLCDIGLPGMNGYDVARALRGDETTASAHLVALSGYARPDDVAKALAAGFDLHLAKPPDPGKLQEALAVGRHAG